MKSLVEKSPRGQLKRRRVAAQPCWCCFAGRRPPGLAPGLGRWWKLCFGGSLAKRQTAFSCSLAPVKIPVRVRFQWRVLTTGLQLAFLTSPTRCWPSFLTRP